MAANAAYLELRDVVLPVVGHARCRVGCPHPGKLLMHYCCSSSVGIFLQTSMEYFILELGLLASNPFKQSFETFGQLVTHCWLKTLWEKCDQYKIWVTITNLKILPPRAGDKFFIQALVDEGYKGEELVRLNKIRVHQQVLYLSDILNTNGRSVDLKYLAQWEGSLQKRTLQTLILHFGRRQSIVCLQQVDCCFG